MISSNLPNNAANIIASYSSVGQQPAGQEGSSARNSSLKPVEQLASSGRQQFRARDADSQELLAESDSSPYKDDAGSEEQTQEARQQGAQEKRQLEQEQQEIQRLAARDREVRAHEQAHAAVGGQYAGAAQFQYERGPDGVRYAVSGEVPIDVGREATPEATIAKAQIVKRAALAPAEPSPQDRRVAAEASRMETEARKELTVEESREEQAESETDPGTEPTQISAEVVNSTESSEEGEERDVNVEFIRTADSLISSRLNQGIANASLSSRSPGSILDQLA